MKTTSPEVEEHKIGSRAVKENTLYVGRIAVYDIYQDFFFFWVSAFMS